MSLKALHIVFIVASILLCAFVAYWGINSFRVHGELGHLALGVGALISGIGLTWYGKAILVKLKSISYL